MRSEIRLLDAKGCSSTTKISEIVPDYGKDVMNKRQVVPTGWSSLDLAQSISCPNLPKSALTDKKIVPKADLGSLLPN